MNNMITIKKSEYESLLDIAENAADIEAVINSRASNEIGTPSDVMLALVEGVKPLRAWREHRNLTQVELAALTGVNRVMITKIETSTGTGSIATLQKLANALDVMVDNLL